MHDVHVYKFDFVNKHNVFFAFFAVESLIAMSGGVKDSDDDEA